jgi:hypothetical protein
MALGSTQPLTKMSTRNFPGGKCGRRVGLTTLPPSISRMSENVGASTSRIPNGLQGPAEENFYLYIHNHSKIMLQLTVGPPGEYPIHRIIFSGTH